MDFVGEHLAPGKWGHFFLILSLISSIGATFSYIMSVQKSRSLGGHSAATDSSIFSDVLAWKRLARIFFILEVVSVASVFGILVYLIANHYFEYQYVWQHSSRALEPKYLLSCFWEGQEGSFLLWSIWHCILGLIIIWREKEWEAPVMAVVSFTQILLATMIIGNIFGWEVGSNPFKLLRNTFDLKAQIPMLAIEDNYKNYLKFIQDGNDLNPLLQNYWMVIHPPVLFLGFASTIIPFAFAIGGLWTRRFKEWTRSALPWALFSAGILGLGIMMGAAWAYESLNFGGYWAWDPVENASLVPWLVLVAGVHTLLIYRHTGNALRTTFLFFILTFVLVLYSTYLTRSGDLQETSVHAFTGEGITKWHLRVFLLAFALPSAWFFISRYKKIPFIAKEEETSAREFWMFVGSLVLFLSALVIIAMTSIPIFNKFAHLLSKDDLFKPLAVGEETAYQYNRIQIFVAIIIGLFTAVGMYLKYKSTPKSFLRRLLLPTVIGLVVAGLVLGFGDVNFREKGAGYMAAIWIALAAAIYSVIANGLYMFTGFRSLARAGGAIAHLGFAMLLAGILISSSKKEVLSLYRGGIPAYFGDNSKENPGENLTLLKDMRTDMGSYWVTYSKDSTHPKKPLWYYHLDFVSKDSATRFALEPNAFVNYKGNEGLMANPDAQHFWNYDVFAYITSLSDYSKLKDTAQFRTAHLNPGDTAWYSKGFIILESLQTVKNIPGLETVDSASVATLQVQAQSKSRYTMKAILVSKQGQTYVQPDTLIQENLVVQLQKNEGDHADLGIRESEIPVPYVTLKVYKFPFINLVWLGTIITVIGFFVSALNRRRKKKLAKAAAGRSGVLEEINEEA